MSCANVLDFLSLNTRTTDLQQSKMVVVKSRGEPGTFGSHKAMEMNARKAISSDMNVMHVDVDDRTISSMWTSLNDMVDPIVVAMSNGWR